MLKRRPRIFKNFQTFLSLECFFFRPEELNSFSRLRSTCPFFRKFAFSDRFHSEMSQLQTATSLKKTSFLQTDLRFEKF